MRKLIVILLLTFSANTLSAQGFTFERKGDTFVARQSTNSSKGELTKTKYTWQDNKGNKYPIYISKSDSCFVTKTSSKTNKKYKSYLNPEISIQICKGLKITYKPKKGK